jgi:hypothetical protein
MKRPKSLQSLRALLFILKRENFFYILGITLIVLLGGAVSFYFLERGANKAVESIGSAVYWAFISMTTTGYGDISPSTAGGRVIAVIVVISGLLLLSLVTATVVARSDCVLLEITRNDFLRLGEENPRIGYKITRNITQLLCSRLRKADEDTIKLTTALSLALSK